LPPGAARWYTSMVVTRSRLLALALALASGCVIPDLPLEDQRCPCGSGWVCDDAAEVCVRAALRDGGTRDGADADDGGSPVPCAVDLVFDEVEPVTELNVPGEQDDDPTLTADLLEVYFASRRDGGPGGEDIWTARREAPDDPFSEPEPALALSTPRYDTTPRLSRDGLSIYLSSDRAGPGAPFDVFVSTRATLASPWTAPMRVAELSSMGDDNGAAPAPGDLRIAFSSTRAGVAALYEATRESPDDPWGMPAAIPELADAAARTTPFYWSENVLLFAGGSEIWVTRRPTPSMPWGAPVSVPPPVATATNEHDPWLSPDGRLLYFSRFVGTDDLDIYVARCTR
jgi:hypothetical protein